MGDNAEPLPYTSAKSAQWQDKEHSRSPRWGAPPMEIL
jgi:hypothetical protein